MFAKDGDQIDIDLTRTQILLEVEDSLHSKRSDRRRKMTTNRMKIQRLTLMAFFCAIELIMGFTPIGYIPLGALSITTMHLPVLISGMLMGPKFGAGVGFVFGLTSFIRAMMQPGPTSFVFNPFVEVAGIHGNFFSILICFVPRILLGWLSGLMYCKIKKKENHTLYASIISVVNTLIHTALVLGGIYIFFAKDYAQALSMDVSMVGVLLMSVVTSNAILEAILAGGAVPVVLRALNPIAERMGLDGKKS